MSELEKSELVEELAGRRQQSTAHVRFILMFSLYSLSVCRFTGNKLNKTTTITTTTSVCTTGPRKPSCPTVILSLSMTSSCTPFLRVDTLEESPWSSMMRSGIVLVLALCSGLGLVNCHQLIGKVYDASATTGAESLLEKEWSRNPCFKKVCQRGETCTLDRNKHAKCVCVSNCGLLELNKKLFKVCSNNNVTYQSECHLDKDHCLCKNKERDCSSPAVKKIYLEYYGPCKEIPPCSEEYASQFPKRLKDWFYVVMNDMARKAAIGEYQDLWKEVVMNNSHNYAIIWKFCDLDVDPQDRQVSKKELQYFVKTLKSREQCLVPFLNQCDVNNDLDISLQEWGRCLGLKDDEIVDKCHSIHKYRIQK
ncbi:dolichyl-diphosphooligosaccharide--protein glycosyltransferase subunit 1 [Bulinus truncatus]|nr:dolichyl-diphosphooligosaccharide--protein glycosyltransferase subunit 1 [Bulinus truncatus]